MRFFVKGRVVALMQKKNFAALVFGFSRGRLGRRLRLRLGLDLFGNGTLFSDQRLGLLQGRIGGFWPRSLLSFASLSVLL